MISLLNYTFYIIDVEMPIKHAPITPHGTRTSVVSKQPVPISLVGATNSHNAQVPNLGDQL